jgi:hypothetical protein
MRIQKMIDRQISVRGGFALKRVRSSSARMKIIFENAGAN